MEKPAAALTDRSKRYGALLRISLLPAVCASVEFGGSRVENLLMWC